MSTNPWYPEPPLMPGEVGYDATVSRLVAERADASIAGSMERGMDPELARRVPRQHVELDREEIEATLADERGNPSVNGRLAFLSARELVTAAPATVDYVARPWCAIGTLAELDGKPKSAGKTTWILRLIAAVLDGAPFLGEPTAAGPVVLLTEQSRASIAPTLRALGLDRDELRVLTWPDAFGTPWPAIVAAAAAECEVAGARLLIVDTLGQFAGVRGDSETTPGPPSRRWLRYRRPRLVAWPCSSPGTTGRPAVTSANRAAGRTPGAVRSTASSRCAGH